MLYLKYHNLLKRLQLPHNILHLQLLSQFCSWILHTNRFTLVNLTTSSKFKTRELYSITATPHCYHNNLQLHIKQIAKSEWEVFGWSQIRCRIPKNTRSRSWIRVFLSYSGRPIESFLYRTPRLGIPVEMAQFLLKVYWNRILAVHDDFHWLLVATNLSIAKRHSRYVKESESGVGNFGKVGVEVGHFTSESATLTLSTILLMITSQYWVKATLF